MAEKQLAKGMPTSLDFLPEHCVLAKQAKAPVPKMWEGGRAKRLLEKFFSDIAGPEDVQSPNGKMYTLNFVDDFLQKTWVYILKRKDKAFKCFQEWQALVEQETNQIINIFHTDNGGEYSSKDFESYLWKLGVNHQVTAPYTSAQNGKAEQLHRTLFNWAQAMMSENKFSPTLWGECIRVRNTLILNVDYWSQ